MTRSPQARRTPLLVLTALLVTSLAVAAVAPRPPPRRRQEKRSWPGTSRSRRAGSIPRRRRPRSRRSGCSTRSTTRSCGRCPARRWGRASPSPGRRAPTARCTSSSSAAGVKFHNGDPAHRGGREVQLRALQGRRAPRSSRRACASGDRRPRSPCASISRTPWPDFMTFYGTTATAAGLVVPKKYLTQVGRRRLPEASDRGRPVQVRAAARPASRWCSRPTPAYWRHVPHVKRLVMKSVPDGVTRAAMLQERRGGHRLRLRRAGGRRRQARPAPQLVPSQARLDPLARVRRPVGPEVALARQAPPAGREPRARPEGDQRGGVSRLLPARRSHRAARDGLRAPGGAHGLRSEAGQAAPRRGRVSERLRRRRAGPDPAVLHAGRGGGELSERRRHPREDAPDGARGLLRRLAGEEARAGCSSPPRATPATRRAAWSRSSTRRAPTRTAATRTSTTSSSSRRASATRRSARRLLHKIQQLTIDRVMFAPITDFRALMGVGPRVAEHTITWIHNSPFPSYEDMRIK